MTLMRRFFTLDVKDRRPVVVVWSSSQYYTVRGTLGPAGIGPPSIHLVVCKEVKIASLFEA